MPFTYTTRINEMREDIPDNLLEPLNTLIEHGVSPRSDIQHNVNNTITNTYQNILVCIGWHIVYERRERERVTFYTKHAW